MSKAATEINEALKLYRLAEGTPNEDDALAHLQAVVENVKQEQHACCGNTCRWCPAGRVR